MNDSAQHSDNAGFAGIDRVLHEPSRMHIASLLYMIDNADFIFIMNQTGLTWGNLSAHLSKLEEVGYIEIEKTFKGKRPNTSVRMTEKGRESFKEYAQRMRQLFAEFPV
jgi:DNA-binding MarR family transcriptional regulator